MNSNFIEIAHDKEINYLIKKNIAECKTDILIISAFVKVDIIKWIDDNINCSKKELLVRFRKSDIISGATDFELIEYCLLNKWHLKFDLNLHSKIYVFDQEKFLIGSANATNKGLSFIEDSNKETMI
jgi:phosphatidylserine/phosphatidylglycerophosphate/cardiolipin synthase-like enzyme